MLKTEIMYVMIYLSYKLHNKEDNFMLTVTNNFEKQLHSVASFDRL